MARTELTYAQLMALRDDIYHQQKNSASFYYFQKARVERFFNTNQFPLKVLQSRIDEFILKYVKHDEDGRPCTEEKDGMLLFVFATEEEKQAYLKAQNNFLSLKTHIEL